MDGEKERTAVSPSSPSSTTDLQPGRAVGPASGGISGKNLSRWDSHHSGWCRESRIMLPSASPGCVCMCEALFGRQVEGRLLSGAAA